MFLRGKNENLEPGFKCYLFGPKCCFFSIVALYNAETISLMHHFSCTSFPIISINIIIVRTHMLYDNNDDCEKEFIFDDETYKLN